MRLVIPQFTLAVLLLVFLCKGCMEEEREALLQLKSSINSPQESAFSNWYTQDCCQWLGVACDVSNNYVTKIFLQYVRTEQNTDNLWYPDATLFAKLKNLQELHLRGNNIGGFISPNALDNLKHLEKLYLGHNSISDASHLCWGNMHMLQVLDLSWNKLEGQVPRCICRSTSMTKLIFSHNNLEGDIDACFGNMSSLGDLALSNNNFRGKFPSLLFKNLTNIKHFDVSNNQFEDVIHFSVLANLTKLRYLDISHVHNLTIETESAAWLPSFSLNTLKLANCNLNNRSGSTLPSFISTQYNLTTLDLSENSLTGRIPYWLFYNVSRNLYLSGNRFTWSLPTNHRRNMSSSLSVLDMSGNALQSLPKDIHLIFPQLRVLDVSSNMLTGNIPESLGQMEQLWYLDLSNNKLNGEIPHAITSSNMSALELLDLSANRLHGEAVPRNSCLANLKWLSLGENNLSGELPTYFAPKLRVLSLRRNRLQGQIPTHICQMEGLHFLDLSYNNLSGEIPTCLDNITSLTSQPFEVHPWSDKLYNEHQSFFLTLVIKGHLWSYNVSRFLLQGMDISCNMLTGTIPFQITQLRGLQMLNMSRNLLTGQIPASFGDLTEIESLDLSYNKLSGAVPSNLTTLHFLEAFSVSFNNLSGPTPPMVAQFAIFDSSSYVGNPNLCGRPLGWECSLMTNQSYSTQMTNQSYSNRQQRLKAPIIIKWATLLFFFFNIP